jgi:hypothetical protein
MCDLVILQDQHIQTKSILIYEIISIKADYSKNLIIKSLQLGDFFSYSSALFSKAVVVDATTFGFTTCCATSLTH